MRQLTLFGCWGILTLSLAPIRREWTSQCLGSVTLRDTNCLKWKENMRTFTWITWAIFMSLCLLTASGNQSVAQSITSGDVTGTVTDPSGAAIPGSYVTLTNTSTGASQK